MLDNMAGPVGLAMHEDRLARVARNMRLAEAKQGRRATVNGGGYREAVAMALQGLAARIAPVAAGSGEYTRAMGR